MIPQRQNRFSGVSLAPPEPLTANFGAPPPMQMPTAPPMEDANDAYAPLQGLAQQFGQGRAEKQLQGHVGQLTDQFVGRDAPLSTAEGASGMTLSKPQRFSGSLDLLKGALKGAF